MTPDEEYIKHLEATSKTQASIIYVLRVLVLLLASGCLVLGAMLPC